MASDLAHLPTWPVQAVGSPLHPAVVFLHGFMGNREDWHFLLPEFAENFYCILLDLPGHGQNQGNLPAEPLTFAWLSTSLEQVLNKLRLPAVHLVGYSMGGRLALYFTVYYPQRVKSLVLESASPGLANLAVREARLQEDKKRAERLKEIGMKRFLDEWYGMPLFNSLQKRPDILDELKLRRQDNDPYELARIIAELSPGQQPDLWGDLEDISIPVLLLAGEQDEKYSHLVQEMAKQIPQVWVSLASVGGHNLHLEVPDWYIQQLRDFLVNISRNSRHHTDSL